MRNVICTPYLILRYTARSFNLLHCTALPSKYTLAIKPVFLAIKPVSLPLNLYLGHHTNTLAIKPVPSTLTSVPWLSNIYPLPSNMYSGQQIYTLVIKPWPYNQYPCLSSQYIGHQTIILCQEACNWDIKSVTLAI